jgi:iron complex outermembrane receptor protein
MCRTLPRLCVDDDLTGPRALQEFSRGAETCADRSLTEYASVDNLADRRYVGSVIVNKTNSRFFEPAPGRTVC